MNVEQELVDAIRTHSNITTLCSLCDEVGDLNELVAVPVHDGSGHTFTTTFLDSAISCDNVEAVALLLQKGADPNFTDSRTLFAGPPLYQLSIFVGSTAEEAKKQITITKLMLDHGADPNQIILKEGKTVYQYAKEMRSVDYDPVSDYDYRFDYVFLELLEAKLHESLKKVDMESLLSTFDD